MSENKPKSSSFSKTLPPRPRDGLNQSMLNTSKTDADKNPSQDSPASGVDERAPSNKTQKPANAQELKKQEPVQGQKSHIATGGASGNKTQKPEKPANAPEQKKQEPVQGQKSDIATGRDSGELENTMPPCKNCVKKERKIKDQEKEYKDLLDTVDHLNNKITSYKSELEYLQQNNKEVNQRIEKNDETLKNLDEEVKKLKTDNKLMEADLKKAIQERDERQSMVQNMERHLEKLNSENTGAVSRINELFTENAKLKEEKTKTANDIKKLTSEKSALEADIEKRKKYMEKVFRDNKKMLDEVIEDNEKEVRSLNNKLSEIIKERDDLKTRFSKLAGAKLTDQNADIADLSDPNRAMKVSERFGQLYDDEWTDAFEELKKKKMDGKDAIQLLLRILQECHAFCNNLKEVQIDSLNNVLLHPSQDITKFANEHRKNVGGLKERQRISSKDEKAVRNLRRQIGVSNTCIEEVKQVFVLETKSWVDRGFDKKQLEVCKPYLEKCAEVCWLMVLHDPPLYMKMDASEGDKMDPNLYTVYSTSGDKIKYLVWPPLYNEAGGGLISKGVAECVKVIKKN